MKMTVVRTILSVGLLLSVGAFSASAQTAQPLSRIASVVLFDGPNFTGRAITVEIGQDGSNLNRFNFNDRTSSIRVAGDWQVCEHANYGGSCRRFTGDVASLGGFDNQISSVRFVGAQTPNRPTVPPSNSGPANAPRTGLRLFDTVGYFGTSFDAPTDVSNLRSSGFNDRASSLALASGEVWEVCVDANYGSRCQRFDSSVADLSTDGMDNTISSMRRLAGGPTTPQRPQVPGNGFGNPQRPAIVNVTGETPGVDGVLFFAIPRVNGSAVDHCSNSSLRTCGDSGADLVCQMAGARDAASYTIADPRRYGSTVHVDNGAQCRGNNCGAIVNLLCSAN